MSSTLTEHIEYLSLPGRNALFKKAIESTIENGCSVADLGCGVGVLGFLCLDAGAGRVWGIDHSDAIHLASESAERAGYGERYSCIKGSTFSATLPERVDLLICDHVGFFGFDYGIIQLISDARDRLLKPGGRVLPESLDLVIAAVSSDNSSDIANQWTSSEVPEQFHWLDELNKNMLHPYRYSPDELISNCRTVGSVDLDTKSPEHFSFNTRLNIRKAGVFSGLAGWFDCHLGAGVRMTNSPLDPASIKRAQAFLPAAEPFSVQVNDVVEVSLRFLRDGTMISWSVKPAQDGKVQRLSTWKSTILNSEHLRDDDSSLSLSDLGEAMEYFLHLVRQSKSKHETSEALQHRFPDLFPTQRSLTDFMREATTRCCKL